MKSGHKLVIILLAVAVFAAIGIAIFGAQKRKKKQKEIREIEDIIDKGIGQSGTTTVNDVLHNVKPAPYGTVKQDVDKLLKADGTLIDNDEAVYAVLRGKTKGQVAALNQTMQQQAGKTLDQFLIDIFKDYQDYSLLEGKYSKYEKALSMINSAG